ncbi:hypothetical protein D8674_016704 [Pyrus ussuriensis x Pyrus communis]|uniref:Uncharacterized protein n=1 Tax=Pyrus ussuriensis x Pyrus communis TaxID=2448454 RepID=A0A5N5HP30_9ROSA|nr:hypothetical protein D8674_016704 [Pyrus ussuriensis x Pyrus communis]
MVLAMRSSVLPVLVTLLLLTWPATQVVHGQDSCSAACYNGVMSCVVGCTNNGSQLTEPSCPDECTEDYDSCMEICMPDPEKLSAPTRP